MQWQWYLWPQPPTVLQILVDPLCPGLSLLPLSPFPRYLSPRVFPLGARGSLSALLKTPRSDILVKSFWENIDPCCLAGMGQCISRGGGDNKRLRRGDIRDGDGDVIRHPSSSSGDEEDLTPAPGVRKTGHRDQHQASLLCTWDIQLNSQSVSN